MDTLKKDIEQIYKLNLQDLSVRLWLPYVSQYSSKEAWFLYNKAASSWHQAVEFIRKNLPNNMPSYTSLSEFKELNEVKRMRKEFDNRIKNLIRHIESQGVSLDNVAFLVAASAYQYAKMKWPDLHIFELQNVSFGGSYTISAVMTRRDVFAAIEKNKLSFKHYALPSEMFDYFKFDMSLAHIKDYGLSIFTG